MRPPPGPFLQFFDLAISGEIILLFTAVLREHRDVAGRWWVFHVGIPSVSVGAQAVCTTRLDCLDTGVTHQ